MGIPFSCFLLFLVLFAFIGMVQQLVFSFFLKQHHEA